MTANTLVETVNDAMLDAFKNTASEDIGCIVYVFDRSVEGGGIGFNDKNCDTDDAMVAMERVSEWFGIDLEMI